MMVDFFDHLFIFFHIHLFFYLFIYLFSNIFDNFVKLKMNLYIQEDENVFVYM